jgi:hypothetical protein
MLDTTLIDQRVELTSSPAHPKTTYSAVAVYEGAGQWTALCLELDIATMGETANEALSALKSAVRDAIELAEEQGLEPGTPVTDEALAELLHSHRPSGGSQVAEHFEV